MSREFCKMIREIFDIKKVRGNLGNFMILALSVAGLFAHFK